LVLGAEAVGNPSAHAGAGAEAVAGVELQHGLGVDAGVAVHGVEHAEFVGVAGEIGQEFGDPEAALTAPLKADDGAGMRFFADLRFVIKGIELGGAAAHVEEDDAIGAGA
jgi:hypothetical protein